MINMRGIEMLLKACREKKIAKNEHELLWFESDFEEILT